MHLFIDLQDLATRKTVKLWKFSWDIFLMSIFSHSDLNVDCIALYLLKLLVFRKVPIEMCYVCSKD